MGDWGKTFKLNEVETACAEGSELPLPATAQEHGSFLTIAMELKGGD